LKGSTGRTAESAKTQLRCAIYTRKSTEEGLEQEFNSLHAQRESGESYIASMKHEGWTCNPEQYDDGGFTGGNIERPALKRLMADIEAGLVDVVVVYKVDRLSRSLMDFARLMSLFDRKKVSFVSVTQQFNTTHSMGRLTLNILLSFAQFEREIISERTRDKIAASRRKGKWIGGRPILGYDVRAGKLIVNESEAARVREIFELYLELGSFQSVVVELARRGWRNKSWTTAGGKAIRGLAISKGRLSLILSNVAYIGMVRHQNETFNGEHEGIVSRELWDAVHAKLQINGSAGTSAVRNRHHGVLKGVLCCSCGAKMGHTSAGGRRKTYRYYICPVAHGQTAGECQLRGCLPAEEIENLVVTHLGRVGRDGPLVAAVHERVSELQRERVAELEQTQTRLELQIESLSAKAALAETNEELQGSMQRAARRLASVRSQLRSIGKPNASRSGIRRELEEFAPVWSMLSPTDRAAVISHVLAEVRMDTDEGEIEILFRDADGAPS
jgi:site-specific DNA recombinase